MTPEKRALVCCARVDLDASKRAELAALADGGLDFAALVADAARHGLTPLLSRHLGAVIPDACPPALLSDLRANVQSHVLTSLALAAELVAVLESLRTSGIAAIAVKGPVSAALCYGDLGLRTFADLDLLITPEQVEQATSVLEARGYLPQLDLSRSWARQLVRTDSERLFRHGDGLRLIDLHWCLMPPGYSFTPQPDGLFSRRYVTRVGAAEIPTLGLEPTLLFLLLHGMKHEWGSLGWLCDVAELLRRHTLDWGAILEWSGPRGPRRVIDVGLSLAHSLLDAPVPHSALARGRQDPSVARIVGTLTRQLLEPHTNTPRSLFRRSFGVAYFRVMERPADRLRLVHDVVLRPTQHEWRAVPLPTALAPLHYFIRPLRLLWKHARPRRTKSETPNGESS